MRIFRIVRAWSHNHAEHSSAAFADGSSDDDLFAKYNKKLQQALKNTAGVPKPDDRFFDTYQKLELNVARFAAAKSLHAEHLLSKADDEDGRKKVLAAHEVYLMAETQVTTARTRTAKQ